jgi:hypothetical protein
MRGDAAPRTPLEFLQRLEKPRGHDDEIHVTEVLAPNWNTVETFRCCTWDVIASVAGIHYAGISAAEIRAALIVSRIPRAEWPLITRGIQAVMVPAAQKNLNAKKG